MRAAQRDRPARDEAIAAQAPPEAAKADQPDDARAAAGGVGVPCGGTSGPRRAKNPQAVLYDLLRGLRAGDLECVLLTVAMAADENRMPSVDPDEATRILAFLTRLAEHDAALPPGPSVGTGQPVDADGVRS